MATSYLHDPEIIEVENGARPVKTVKSAAIGLIGTAPIGDTNTSVQCLSEKDATAFGSQFTGFTIPQVLDAIYDHDAGIVLIVNVLDLAKHETIVEDEVVTFDKSTGQAKLAHPVVASVVVEDGGGSTTYAANTDYRIDMQADVLTNPGKATEVGGSVKANYEYADPSKVAAADTIGGVNSVENRTGVKLLNDSFNLYGYLAKIPIVLVLCAQKGVAAELIAMAEKLGAITYIDVPVGTTFAQALAGRGPEGTINFNTSSGRARLYYPHVRVYDLVTNTERLEPFSQCAAGLRAKVDLDKGYRQLSSNQETLGITGVERQLSVMINDLQSEVNLPNRQRITAVFSSYSSGLRLWGNRMVAWLTITHIRSFENVRRIGDMINGSIRYFNQQYIDMPVTQALIDALTESVNAYGRKMTGDGAILGFRCWLDPARNPETELAAGYLLLSHKYMPSPSLERLAFETEIISEYLLILKGGNRCQGSR